MNTTEEIMKDQHCLLDALENVWCHHCGQSIRKKNTKNILSFIILS